MVLHIRDLVFMLVIRAEGRNGLTCSESAFFIYLINFSQQSSKDHICFMLQMKLRYREVYQTKW